MSGHELSERQRRLPSELVASDGSAVLSMGNTCRAAALCIPTQNTHGFEIIHQGAIGACARTLAAHLLG